MRRRLPYGQYINIRLISPDLTPNIRTFLLCSVIGLESTDSDIATTRSTMQLGDQQTRTLNSLCRQFHVRRLQLFGSAARQIDFNLASDIDLLVEFEEGHEPPLSALLQLQDELSELFERHVDLATPSILNNPFRRKTIERDLEQIYAA